MLIAHLPPESATQTALREAMTPEQAARAAQRATPGQGPWSHAEMLLAALIDVVNMLRYERAGNGKGRPPNPVPRPGIASNVVPINQAAMDYLQRLRDNRGAVI